MIKIKRKSMQSGVDSTRTVGEDGSHCVLGAMDCASSFNAPPCVTPF